MPGDEEISKQVPRASGFFLTECLPEDYNDMYHRVNDDGHNDDKRRRNDRWKSRRRKRRRRRRRGRAV